MEEKENKKEEFLPFVLMDKADDDLIAQELQGKIPEILTYHFNEGGREIWGLSKAGVDEAKAELAKKGEVIRELEAHITSDGSYFYAKVKAARYAVSQDGKEVLLDVAFGFKRQALYYKNGQENPFAYEQAAIKACRNAVSRLIPKIIIQSIIEFAKRQNKVKEIKVEEEQPEAKPESKNQSKAESKKDYGFLKTMAKAKKVLGEEIYYSVLNEYGYDHADEIHDPENKQLILEEMRKAYIRKKGE